MNKLVLILLSVALCTSASLPNNTSLSLSPVARMCKCPSMSFESRFHRAHSVLRVLVLHVYESCRFCPNHFDRRKAIRLYRLLVQRRLKGPRRRSIITVQAFANPDYCGVRLRRGYSYMINLDSPHLISRASHWLPGRAVLNACQGHWAWRGLSLDKLRFLNSRGGRRGK